MKIIARANESYIIEATGAELARIAGFDSPDNLPNQNGRLPIGLEFDVAAAWSYLTAVRANFQQITQLEALLRHIADGIAAAIPEISKNVPP